MYRYSVFLTTEQLQALEDLDGLTVSEHIRRAVDEYLEKQHNLNVATSDSVKGGKNGRKT